MPTVKDVCHHVRSKHAVPFWATFDLFFNSEDNFRKYSASPSLGPDLFNRLYGADTETVKACPVPDLNMIKISYGRSTPQGGEVERDMHSGQQYVRLLDIELAEAP
jgi:hypothetical protein